MNDRDEAEEKIGLVRGMASGKILYGVLGAPERLALTTLVNDRDRAWDRIAELEAELSKGKPETLFEPKDFAWGMERRVDERSKVHASYANYLASKRIAEFESQIAGLRKQYLLDQQYMIDLNAELEKLRGKK